MTNSTFSRNSASSSGGGISNFGTKVTVVSGTFAGNSAAFFDDSIFQNPSTPAATLRNTILASAGANCAVPPGGPITDGGYNVDNGTSCGFSAANNSKPSTDPKLDPNGLQDNGGLTETIALQEGSPAIDQGQLLRDEPRPARREPTPRLRRDRQGHRRRWQRHRRLRGSAVELRVRAAASA